MTLEPKCIPQMSYGGSQTNPHITALKRLRNVKVPWPAVLQYHFSCYGALPDRGYHDLASSSVLINQRTLALKIVTRVRRYKAEACMRIRIM